MLGDLPSMESQGAAAAPLLSKLPLPERRDDGGGDMIQARRLLAKDVWDESKKLGEVVGPAVFMNLVFSSMNIVSQSFAGHISDLDLAAFAMANTVIDGFNFAMLVRPAHTHSSLAALDVRLCALSAVSAWHGECAGVLCQLGMASALETLCGQAYGAKQHHMLGIYTQRSWLVLLAFAVILSPVYVFSGRLLAALGQPAELAGEAGMIGMCFLPSHFMYAILLPVMTFLQCQLKNCVTAAAAAVVFAVHVAATWLLVKCFGLGIFGVVVSFNLSWATFAALLVAYALGGGCPETWSGFSASAFVDLKEFVALSASSGVMLAIIFSSSQTVIDAVDSISVLLALTILLNGIQPVLSGTFRRSPQRNAWWHGCTMALPEKRGGGRFPGLAKELWDESRKLWVVAGPAAFTRLTFYGMTVVSQAFGGHIGDLELAAFSISATVISGLSFGFFVGMASAMETLCGQAYGAKQYHMMGIYLQRSWLILLAVAVLLTPTYIFSGQLLTALGQPAELLYMLPLHFVYAIILPLNKFLQCQRKNCVSAVTTAAVFPVHVAATWLLVRCFRLGVLGAAMALTVSWGLAAVGLLSYAFGGGCPETWRGFSASAFVDLKDFVKLSAASGVMLW
ncbi:hypothetical protein HU200_001084 [Digitaria exilis]|uniref:Protein DETOXIFICATION n=1 Tax=Digitaria exilis TaxID=1010633 RepID=A0A835KWH5_9POAL|nr:hypothetical protein HU200_001084 [Digitaria exilis]